ncbi:MAG: hypothetical protein Q3M24_11110 [Candidatus Electrothrix aestuarii]|uniref:Tetratricopeptide repeat-containing protein n=1 Tax=Candidatus Electrothrix aestuarii TaxID=3062594 RepID=A0AAU8M2B2_9BACT|nr:hypothetical protein [Candidatus Electrothrix aestuarii]
MAKKKQGDAPGFLGSLGCQEKIRLTDSLTAQACGRFQVLARLWQEGRVREMRNVSHGTDFLHPVVLELQAKASYLVLQEKGRLASPDEVRHFIDCWLSFLFHPALFRSLSEKPEAPEQYRLGLLAAGEKMVRRYAEQQESDAEQLLRHWEEESRLLKTLCSVKTEEMPLYTPALAWEVGIAEQFMHLIEGNLEAFTDQEEFLAAGALYSVVGPGLLLVRRGQYEQANKELVSLWKKKKKNRDSFLAYGLACLARECGAYFLEQGRYEDAETMLTGLLPLPAHARRLEQGLLAILDREDQYLNPDWLTVSVHVLSELHKYAFSTEAVKKALSTVLTHQAVLLHNIGAVDAKVLLTSMEKAVTLNPEDEFARVTFDDVQMDAEIHSLHQTMSSGQLDKASRIAQKSSYPEVTSQFFTFVAQVIEQVEDGDYPDDTSAFFMLQQLLEGALNVNPEHPMIRELALLLDDLEDRLEEI